MRPRSEVPWGTRQVLAGVLASCVCLGLSACVSQPTLALHHAEVTGVTRNGLGLNVVVQVNNKNSFDVQVRDVNVAITVADRYNLGPVRFSPNTWLQAKRSTLLAVPVQIPWNVVPGLLQTTAGSETVSYRVKGTADVTATRLLAIQRNDEPIDETGEIKRSTLVGAARVALPQAR